MGKVNALLRLACNLASGMIALSPAGISVWAAAVRASKKHPHQYFNLSCTSIWLRFQGVMPGRPSPDVER